MSFELTTKTGKIEHDKSVFDVALPKWPQMIDAARLLSDTLRREAERREAEAQ